jgi:hypothetical protein
MALMNFEKPRIDLIIMHIMLNFNGPTTDECQAGSWRRRVGCCRVTKLGWAKGLCGIIYCIAVRKYQTINFSEIVKPFLK